MLWMMQRKYRQILCKSPQSGESWQMLGLVQVLNTPECRLKNQGVAQPISERRVGTVESICKMIFSPELLVLLVSIAVVPRAEFGTWCRCLGQQDHRNDGLPGCVLDYGGGFG